MTEIVNNDQNNDQPTKQEVTKKFIVGMVLIAASLIIGKLVLLPLIIFPKTKALLVSLLAVYIIAWIMMIVGIALAGWEGYRLATHKYKEYKQKTLHHVKNQGKIVAQHTKDAAKNTHTKVKEKNVELKGQRIRHKEEIINDPVGDAEETDHLMM